ncbi:Plus3 domain-containing protein [Meloidogyne graminicola]|uniref:Plus3 domain-containing protein n=1 Tax=Meloidogyne graminicola TaxID=189291 RepID=A0A8S9ZVZ3_9BILA|nr:Plus3 domain-containing protein [Meloidogyne graminicola]
MSKNKSDKKQNVSSDSNNEEGINDDEFDLSMDENERERFNQMSEKEREIEIFKRLEQRELMKTREQIKRKLELAAGNKQSNTAKRKRIPSHETDEDDSDYEVGKNGDKKSSDEEGELHDDDKDDTSSDDDNVISSKPSSSTEKRRQKLLTKTPINTENVEQDDEDTAYHKPSELVNKYNKKMAMADLINKRRDKKQAEEKRKKENQKAALDLDEIFGKEDGKSSSSSSSPASSRSSSPVYGKSRSPSPVSQPIEKLDDLLKCQAIRRRLARIVHAPFFNKTIVGCFVRVQIGSHDGKPTYRIAQVVDVVETAKIYEVEPNTDIRTNKGLKLKESPLPTIDFVKKKQKEMIDALNYKYTDSEINLMNLEDAEQNGDKERVRDLQHQINDLEEKAKKIESQRTKNLSAITAINQRNRDHMKQFLSAEHMQNNEHFQVRDDDPFTRKSARMKLVTGVTRVKSDAESLDISNGSVSLDSTLNLSGKPSILKNSSSVLPPPGDLFSAHGIDINIDLDKVLPATTTISLRAPPSASTSTSSLNQQRIPQKSSRTLTLEEYKRKYSSRMT